MRKLIWTESAEGTLRDVVEVLNVINPKGHTVEYIKASVQRAFDDGLTSYVGMAGWYVCVYQAPDSDTDWHALPTIMAYSVKHWLAAREV
jgi:hypothetical protein